MHYHNTTYTGSQRLAEYEAQASKQDTLVLEFMAHNRHLSFTAENIADHVLPTAPITSSRRALSNLYARGRVRKIDQIDGMYGRPVTVWGYRNDN